jgi:hypothetical protein
MLMSVGQFSILLRNPTFHCHVHNSPPIVPILIPTNPVHTLPPHFFKTCQQSAILTRGLIPSYFPTITLHEISYFTTRATSPWLRFFRAFSSVVRQMPGYNSPRRGTARTVPIYFCVVLCVFCVVLCIVFCVVLCIFCVVLFFFVVQCIVCV